MDLMDLMDLMFGSEGAGVQGTNCDAVSWGEGLVSGGI